MTLPKNTTSALALCVALALGSSAHAQQINNISIQSTSLDSALLSLAEHSDIQILFFSRPFRSRQYQWEKNLS